MHQVNISAFWVRPSKLCICVLGCWGTCQRELWDLRFYLKMTIHQRLLPSWPLVVQMVSAVNLLHMSWASCLKKLAKAFQNWRKSQKSMTEIWKRALPAVCVVNSAGSEVASLSAEVNAVVIPIFDIEGDSDYTRRRFLGRQHSRSLLDICFARLNWPFCFFI